MKKFKLKMDGDFLHLEIEDGISSTELESLINQLFNSPYFKSKHDIAIEDYMVLSKS